jgi:hypothetical protein
METIVRQARNWIYPRIGTTKLKDFTATDADKFFKELSEVLGKWSLVMIKSTLRRSIRRNQVHNLIGRNVVELIDFPAASRAALPCDDPRASRNGPQDGERQGQRVTSRS